MPDLPASRWQRLDTLLAEALARDPTEREAYLRAACADDPALYREASEMLAQADDAAQALGESAAVFASTLLPGDAPPEGLPPGTRVGPYRIEGEAGRGGMGVVYRARRADGAFDKTVALKLVKRGMDTDEVLARFRRERQVLAGLDHPGIARLLDGGAAEDGRPYLAMEYVEGEPITDHCNRVRLDLEARLSLFERACEAVQHAHRRLVVHRDLKPSNVLVAEGEDGRPQVKLLDFGIARLLDAAPDEALTQQGGGRLTPAYAAPEQLRGEEVTTATDVYALGTLLYELLTGRRPDPMPASPSTVAEEERAKALRGDLDTIVLKALREEPEARYPSVEALLDDLRRRREGLPIHARSATVGYRMRKFVRRHRVGVAVTAAFVLALAVAVTALALAQQRAAREAERAERARDFALSLFEIADPDQARGQDVTAVVLLDAAAARADEELADEPEVLEVVLDRLSDVNYRLGRYGEAQRLTERILALRRVRLSPTDTLITRSLNDLGVFAQTFGNFDEAQALHEEVLALRRASLPPDHPDLALSHFNLGVTARSRGDLDAAERHHREALRIRQAHFGPEAPEVAQSLKSLALVQHQRGAYDEAEALYRQALALTERLDGTTSREAGMMMNSLASLLAMRGDYGEADTLFQRGLAMQRDLFEEDHPSLARTLMNYGLLLIERGMPEAAEAPLSEARAMVGRSFAEGHPAHGETAVAYALALREQGRLAEAARLLEEAVAALVERPGPQHALTGRALAALAEVRLAEGDTQGADALYQRVQAIQEADLPAEHPDRAGVLVGRGRVALAQNRPTDAEPLFRRALALRREALGEGHPHTSEAETWLGACLAAQGRRAEAATLLEASARVLNGPTRPSIEQAVRAHLGAHGS